MEEDHISKMEFDDFKQKVEAFIKKAEPLIDAYNGAGALGNIIKSAGGVVLALGALYAALTWLINK